VLLLVCLDYALDCELGGSLDGLNIKKGVNMATAIPVIYIDDDKAITTIGAWTCAENYCDNQATTKYGVCEKHESRNGGDGSND